MSLSFLFSFFLLDSLGGLLCYSKRVGELTRYQRMPLPHSINLLSTTESEGANCLLKQARKPFDLVQIITKLSSRENPNYLQVNNLIFSLKSIFVEFDIFYQWKEYFLSRLNYLSTNRELFRLVSWSHAFWLCVGGVIDDNLPIPPKSIRHGEQTWIGASTCLSA